MVNKEDWIECRLGDVLTLKRGYDLPQKERIPGAIPIVSSSGVTGFHQEAKVKGPGVVTGRYGTLGKAYYIPGDFWPLNTRIASMKILL
jgi:type I restriction enzyme S subunit